MAGNGSGLHALTDVPGRVVTITQARLAKPIFQRRDREIALATVDSRSVTQHAVVAKNAGLTGSLLAVGIKTGIRRAGQLSESTVRALPTVVRTGTRTADLGLELSASWVLRNPAGCCQRTFSIRSGTLQQACLC